METAASPAAAEELDVAVAAALLEGTAAVADVEEEGATTSLLLLAELGMEGLPLEFGGGAVGGGAGGGA